MLLDLAAQDSACALDRRRKHYARVHSLVIDEFSYLSYDIRNADLLLSSALAPYEKESVVLATLLPLAMIFPSAIDLA